jgi:cystathionine gamma-synthase
MNGILRGMRLETIAVHAGGDIDPATGSVSPPIHLSTTFEHGPASEVLHGYLYTREGNPVQSRLEQALAALEGGPAALAFASGMAAGSAYLQSLPSGSHILFHRDVYHSLRSMGADFLERWGCEAEFVDMCDLDTLRKAIRPNTRLVWMETPSNPLLDVVDIAGVAAIAHGTGAKLVVDGTFGTPMLQRPLELGADVVLHSSTKYFGGHSDVQGGALVFAERDASVERIEHIRHLLGAVASPFGCWLVLRGLRTLPCRMERHSANAQAIAEALLGHPALDAVLYPGLPSHPGHAVARRQMKSFGGMLSLRVKGGRAQALEVASRVKLFVNATSLGGVESLLEHRVSSEGPASKTPEDLLRLSVGLEHPDDLIEDLRQALDGKS